MLFLGGGGGGGGKMVISLKYFKCKRIFCIFKYDCIVYYLVCIETYLFPKWSNCIGSPDITVEVKIYF